MGSSARKKKDKQKDFQKPKLKVGKAKPKPSNFTDTSFKSKCEDFPLTISQRNIAIVNHDSAIVLKQQSIATSAPSANALFTHHLSLLSHRSDTQRRESLAYLTTAITTRRVESPLYQPLAIIIPKLLPLLQDGSNSVRVQLVKLLRSLPGDEIEEHVHLLLLYTQLGMNHLAADIRWTALDILEWLLAVAGSEVVSCAGGWTRTLNCFLVLLGWQVNETTKWSSGKASFGKASSEGKMLVKQLNVLTSFLREGLGPQYQCSEEVENASNFPLWHAEQHMPPKQSSCFDHLSLFGRAREEETEFYDNAEDRAKLFNRYQPAVEHGLQGVTREGGEVGRTAAAALKTVKECMQYHQDDKVS
ncbi:MAG: rRNA processing protein [Candelina mexicana]|nr:MAG: rRNA processing protein [Candelina mexicana]